MKKFLMLCLVAALAAVGLAGCDPNRTDFLLIGTSEIWALPRTGPAWDQVVVDANKTWAAPNIHDQDSKVDTDVLAGAIYANAWAPVNTDQATVIRNKTIAHLMALAATPNTAAGRYYDGDTANPNGRVLATARQIPAYVLAADLVTLTPADKATFVTFLNQVKYWVHSQGHSTTGGNNTLVATAQRSVNNWGTMSRAAVVAIDAYSRDNPTELQDMVDTHKAWMGAVAPNQLQFGDTAWYGDMQAVYGRKAGIVGKSASLNGYLLGGTLAEEQRRGGEPASPFLGVWPSESYVWEAMQGEVLAASILKKTGIDPDAFTYATYGSYGFDFVLGKTYGTGNFVAKAGTGCNPGGSTSDDWSTYYMLRKFNVYPNGVQTFPTTNRASDCVNPSTDYDVGVPAGKNFGYGDFLFPYAPANIGY